MGRFERYLSVWVGLSILLGLALGSVFPAWFAQLATLDIARVNLVIAVLIWLMIYPMMIEIDLGTLKSVGQQPKGLVLTLVINWLIKPFTMAALGWLFFRWVFVDWVDPQSATEYIAGMILLGAAPCTAMVFVWSQLTRGNANYTLVQVTLNDLILIVAYAPLTAWLLGINDVSVPWETLGLSVLLYVVLPVIAGVLTRRWLLTLEDTRRQRFTRRLKPGSIFGLLLTVLLLFGLQAPTVLEQPLMIVLIAIPLLLQTYGVFALAYGMARALKLPYAIAAPACMIGTSNFFELAVAVAIALFGLDSGAALATVVGVLVEVPVMLSLVGFSNRTRHWFEKVE
ncbi:ACR3 family arsenite efflux transporter [Saccharospirillum mangrovi]|uniref:ACR3 family arsenite efflux transporter n=1 Tax=Saccharospirillum mangrovi TaxID=2161747 RepID=UPI000D39C955|nr:ACR3 family arsenite efflux transporter [Saccharospirillum mangrovi]